MKEKIRVLIEEAGCDEGQAELALEAVQDDLEKAIRNFGTLLRDFVVIKGRFCKPSYNLFGLIIAIVNVRTRHMIRLHTVISYNPVIYETDLNSTWVAFEKQIFAHRLQDGAVQHVSQGIEQEFDNYLKQAESLTFYETIKEGGIDKIKQIFIEQIKKYLSKERLPSSDAQQEFLDDIHLVIEREELNLTQFRLLEDISDKIKPAISENLERDGIGQLYLNISFILEQGGVRAGDLIEGAVVQSLITDNRDIAQYLSRLMGGRIGNEIVPLPSSITSVSVKEKIVEIQTWLAPNIIGTAKLSQDTQIKVLYYIEDEWWHRIYPW